MSPTTLESEWDSELVLIDPGNNIIGEKGEHFQNVSITNQDIARIAIAVKDILKLDIEATVKKKILEKQQPKVLFIKSEPLK